MRVLEGSYRHGEAVSVVLEADHLRSRLDRIDLSPWAGVALVESLENQDYDTARKTQRWLLRLFPRRPGRLRLPPLFFHGEHSQSVELEIAPARDDYGPIQVGSPAVAGPVWLRQPFEVVMEVEAGTPYAGFGIEGVRRSDLRAEPLRHRIERRAGRIVHRLGWKVTPLRAGHLDWQPPLLEYRQGGRVTHRFPPPPVRMEVRPLPGYLPATVPVGRVALKLSLPAGSVLVRDELNFIEARLDQGPQRLVKEVERQLGKGDAVTLYAGVRQPGDDMIFRIPFVAESTGWLEWPAVRLLYFDPGSGRLVSERFPLERRLVLSRGLLAIGAVLFAVLAAGLLYLLWRAMRARWRVLRGYHQALQMARQADDATGLRQALAIMARAEQWPENLTLEQWHRRWQQHYPRIRAACQAVPALQAALYGGNGVSLETLRELVSGLCLRRMPVLKWVGVARPRG